MYHIDQPELGQGPRLITKIPTFFMVHRIGRALFALGYFRTTMVFQGANRSSKVNVIF